MTDTWTNEADRRVVTSVDLARGPVHCAWQDMWFLDVTVAAFPEDDFRHRRTYIANPASDFEVDGWDPDATLPDTAIDTGWRRGAAQLWLAAADGTQAAYLVDGAAVERLPLDETGMGCE